MVNDFKQFLTKSNALALAVGVIIGAASQKVVTAVVEDILMPIISVILPGGDWKEAKIVLKTVEEGGKQVQKAILIGHFAAAVLDFVFIALVVFMLLRYMLKQDPNAPA